MRSLSPTDFISVCFLFFLTLLNCFFFPSIPNAFLFILINCVASFGIIVLSKNELKILRFIYAWYPVILVPLVFKETYGMIHPLWQYDFDDVLIALDWWMFGTNPTQWLHTISSPFLTEILQLAYTSYYFLFLLLGMELYRREPKEEFRFAVFCIVYGFFLSYIGYFLVPAVGPRFTLHDFSQLDIELPGMFLTNVCREIINAGESIPTNVSHPIDYVQRDVFPSGHTQLTLIVMFLSKKFHIKTRWIIMIAGALLIFSTVYLRYHYVVDVLAGLFFMLFTLATAKKIYAMKQR